jgi:hypothetical protein
LSPASVSTLALGSPRPVFAPHLKGEHALLFENAAVLLESDGRCRVPHLRLDSMP